MTPPRTHAHSRHLDSVCIYITCLDDWQLLPARVQLIRTKPCYASDSCDRLGKLLKLTGFVRSKLWLSLGMHEKSHWQCAVPVWLITRQVMAICRLIWNVSAPEHNGYLRPVCVFSRDLSNMSSEEKAVHFSVSMRHAAAAAACVSIMWLLMNLSSESYAITQWAWQCAPDSFVKLLVIVQRLYPNVQQ